MIFLVLDVLPESSSDLQKLIRECGSLKQKTLLRRLDRHVAGENGGISNTILGNLLIQAFGKCGDMASARRVFERITQRNVFSWNIMVGAYTQNGLLDDAQAVFKVMPLRNTISWNTMITAYAQAGKLLEAQSLFYSMPVRDAASWTAMMTAFVKDGQLDKALTLFRLMDLDGVSPTELTFIVAVEACRTYHDGRIVHRCAIEQGLGSKVMVGTALVDMYSKFGDVESAKRVFEGMPERNEVSWNTMLGAYARNGCGHEATFVFEEIPERDVVSWNLLLKMYSRTGYKSEAFTAYERMEKERVTPTAVTFVTLLGCVCTLKELKMLRCKIVRSGLHCEVRVTTALLNAYAGCGSLNKAREIFETMLETDTVVWNVMLAAYACLEGVGLNDFTFTVVLSICSHGGLFKESLEVFNFMTVECGIAASAEHYRCVFDMCGRVGWLKEAHVLFKQMPDNISFTSLVGACKMQS